jgi:hypothetical protein
MTSIDEQSPDIAMGVDRSLKIEMVLNRMIWPQVLVIRE